MNPRAMLSAGFTLLKLMYEWSVNFHLDCRRLTVADKQALIHFLRLHFFIYNIMTPTGNREILELNSKTEKVRGQERLTENEWYYKSKALSKRMERHT